MHITIRHDRTSRALVAYLAAVDGPRWIRHIVGYMQLLHHTPPGCTRQALSSLTRSGHIQRVGYGRYQRAGGE